MIRWRTHVSLSLTPPIARLDQPEMASRWRENSDFDAFPISALAGHLLRGIRIVELYLGGPAPNGEPLDAAMYFQALALTPDISSPLNREAREKG
jgi:hypothetical protein